MELVEELNQDLVNAAKPASGLGVYGSYAADSDGDIIYRVDMFKTIPTDSKPNKGFAYVPFKAKFKLDPNCPNTHEFYEKLEEQQKQGNNKVKIRCIVNTNILTDPIMSITKASVLPELDSADVPHEFDTRSTADKVHKQFISLNESFDRICVSAKIEELEAFMDAHDQVSLEFKKRLYGLSHSNQPLRS